MLSRKLPAIALGVVGLVVLVLVGGLTLRQAGSWQQLDPLPVRDYLDAPGNFLGNHYQIVAIIESQLAYREGVGRLVAVEPEGSELPVPVFVPSAKAQTLNVGQQYRMAVTIREQGLIIVEQLQKL